MSFLDLRSLVVLQVLLAPLLGRAQDENDRTAMAIVRPSAPAVLYAGTELSSIQTWLARFHELEHDAVQLHALANDGPETCTNVIIDAPDLHTVRLTTVMFGAYSTAIDSSYMPWLDRLVHVMEQHPRAHLSIEAHTDDHGTKAANNALSWRRARSVEAYLLEHEVDHDRLTTIGHGERFPIADNKEREGRRRNRRVELRIRLAEH